MGSTVQGGAGAGYNNRVAWVRVFRPDLSPTPRDGWYVVFLFAADGSAVSLSLNQGTTDWSSGRRLQKDALGIAARREEARSFLQALRGPLVSDLSRDISLADPGELARDMRTEMSTLYGTTRGQFRLMCKSTSTCPEWLTF
jgi:5-methylcytosine-specific restriction enzyme MrcB-like protein